MIGHEFVNWFWTGESLVLGRCYLAFQYEKIEHILPPPTDQRPFDCSDDTADPAADAVSDDGVIIDSWCLHQGHPGILHRYIRCQLQL